MNDKKVKPDAGENSLNDDLGRGKPVLRGSAVKQQLQRAEAKPQDGESEPVKLQRGVAVGIAESEP